MDSHHKSPFQSFESKCGDYGTLRNIKECLYAERDLFSYYNDDILTTKIILKFVLLQTNCQ